VHPHHNHYREKPLMASFFNALYNRLANEPVLIGTALVAVGNLLGHDLSGQTEVVTTVVLFRLGAAVRHFVTPTRKLG
jgi:hypothetical protein